MIFFCLSHLSEAVASNFISIPIHEGPDLDALPADFKEKIIRKRVPFIRSYWISPPDIRLCLTSGVSPARLRKALSYWERLGYKFGTVSIERDTSTCFSGGRYGEITILLFNNSVNFDFSSHLAITQVYYHTSLKYIMRAQIYINSYGSKKERTLEHEIGHALGWAHYNRRYHIMNENHNFGGHDSTGLKRSAYNDYIEDITNTSD
jgi:hypothetical protein